MSVRRSKGVGKADIFALFRDGKADREARRLQRHDVSGRISARVRITAGLPLLPCNAEVLKEERHDVLAELLRRGVKLHL